ncbi:MAG: hypothetical protein Q7T20_08090 [Saprospiraceae bacterium]|nr:hypothetical protein [Saprospiraceae bacterium]
MRIKTFASALLIFALFGFTQYVPAPTPDKSESTTSKPSLISLKAVLIVGHLEDGTAAAMESMDEIADLFRSKGVTVHCFYDHHADWEKIRTASKDANFFVYAGHGSTMGAGGKTGGLCIKTMISSKNILEGLQLPKNSMVIFKSVCRGAGSSATDNGDIGINEALERVSDYAQPFFKSGASCYYANNLGDGCTNFIEDFFSGKPIKECFEKSAKPWAKIELVKKYAVDQTREIGIASTDWGGVTTRTTHINGVKKVEKIPSHKQYDIAYVSNSTFSIRDMRE